MVGESFLPVPCSTEPLKLAFNHSLTSYFHIPFPSSWFNHYRTKKATKLVQKLFYKNYVEKRERIKLPAVVQMLSLNPKISVRLFFYFLAGLFFL